MCFFFKKKLKVKEVYNYFIFQAVTKKIAGFEIPKDWKFGKSFEGKSICYTNIVTQYKKWDLACRFYFDKDKQEVQMDVYFNNLPLNGNNDAAKSLQKAIDDRFSTLRILYMDGYTSVNAGKAVCHTREELVSAIDRIIATWNNSGFLPFVDANFKTAEELRRR